MAYILDSGDDETIFMLGCHVLDTSNLETAWSVGVSVAGQISAVSRFE